jgi:hypothetical protein
LFYSILASTVKDIARELRRPTAAPPGREAGRAQPALLLVADLRRAAVLCYEIVPSLSMTAVRCSARAAALFQQPKSHATAFHIGEQGVRESFLLL